MSMHGARRSTGTILVGALSIACLGVVPSQMARTSPASLASQVAVAYGTVLVPAEGKQHVLLLDFLVSRGLQGTLAKEELVVVVLDCLSAECVRVGMTVQPLASGDFWVSPDLHSATLSTEWLGEPLTIDWQHHDDQWAFDGNVSVSVAEPYVVLEGFSVRMATASITMLGRDEPCPDDVLGSIDTAAFGQRDPRPYSWLADTAVRDRAELQGDVDCLQ